jgi:hypothetical protein
MHEGHSVREYLHLGERYLPGWKRLGLSFDLTLSGVRFDELRTWEYTVRSRGQN